MKEKSIKSAYSHYINSKEIKNSKSGEEYYRVKNTAIVNRKKRVVVDSSTILDFNPFAANHKIPNGSYRVLVDQKLQYLLGNGITTEDNESLKELDKMSSKRTFLKLLKELVLEAANKGSAWIYLYKDRGDLKFKKIPREQLHPVYNMDGELEKMYRFYKSPQGVVALEYDFKGVTTYLKQEEGFKVLSTRPHYIKTLKGGNKILSEEGFSFHKIPFIKLKNDIYEDSDLDKVKSLIDIYDIIESDFACNIDDMQDAFFTLKGYSGDAETAFEFLQELKATKAIPINETGDVGVHQLQIPTEAREKLLDRLNIEIFTTGMGVDTAKLSGGSLTNVHIKAMFSNLDLKCDGLEEEIREFIYKLMEFINIERGIEMPFNYSFNRALIINKEDLTDSIG
ncbi:MAG: phage portal protein, partial [Bacteroidales bacterium]